MGCALLAVNHSAMNSVKYGAEQDKEEMNVSKRKRGTKQNEDSNKEERQNKASSEAKIDSAENPD